MRLIKAAIKKFHDHRRMNEVKLDGELRHEWRIRWRAGRLLEPVREKRTEDAQLAHAGAYRRRQRYSRRGDEHPRDAGEAGATGKDPYGRYRDRDETLDTVRDIFHPVVRGNETLALDGRGDALVGAEQPID